MRGSTRHRRISIDHSGPAMTPTAIARALGALDRAALGEAEAVVMDFDSEGRPVDADDELPALTLRLYTVWMNHEED